MKLKSNPRNTNSTKREQMGRRSPNIVSHLSNNIIKNIQAQEKKRLNSTLSPYLGELERRRKIKSVAHQHPSKDKELRKVTREASSKRFRIQECNYKNSSDYLKTITHKSERESNKSIRNFNSSNITKYHQDLSAYTEKPMRIQNQSPTRPPFYSQLYQKLKNKSKRQNKFRRGKYIESSLDGKSDPTPTTQNTTVLQLGFTTNNNNLGITSGGTTISHQKAQKRNFRRGKFDVQSQNINENNNRNEMDNLKYNSAQIQKKQSNSSLIRELDYQIEKDIEIQQKNAKIKMKRQIDKSLQKSTQQYFGDAYDRRKLKSKNEIESYISTVRNPSKIRNSQASTTFHASDARNPSEPQTIPSKTKSFNYNFDIEQDISNPTNIIVIQQSHTNTENNQQSLELGNNEFNRQKKQAERARFQHCNVVGISWSAEQLQFNKLNTQPI